MFNQSDFYDQAARYRSSVAERNDAISHNNYRAWKKYALTLEARAEELAQAATKENARAKMAEAYLKASRDVLLEASSGLVVVGYSNNLGQEIMLYRAQLILGALGMSSSDDLFKSIPAELVFGLQGKLRPESLGLRELKDDEIKAINLRLLCRMEWFDWCLHDRVLSKAENLVLDALLNPSNNNRVLRDRNFCNALKGEVTAYHQMKDQAMVVSDANLGPQSTSVLERTRFENERFKYWKSEGIQFDYYEGNPFPSFKETRKINNKVRFDLHLPAGRLAKEFGVNIETGSAAVFFRKENTAACVLSGISGAKAADFYI